MTEATEPIIRMGERQFMIGTPRSHNPFKYGNVFHDAWDKGWCEGHYWNYGVYP